VKVAVLALPRTGSAWLATCTGMWHDPLTVMSGEALDRVLERGEGVVDTGAGLNAITARDKYESMGYQVHVLLRDPAESYGSLIKAGWTPNFELARSIDIAYADLDALNRPVHHYPNGVYELAQDLTDKKAAMWRQMLETNIQREAGIYWNFNLTPKYEEWVNAPIIR